MFSPASGIEARTTIPPLFRRWKMFEHSLIDLDAELEAKTNPRRRRWISLPLAIGLHLVGLTAFAFASYWNVGPVTEPSLNVAFIDVLLPPPPPAGGGGHPKPPVPEQPKTAPAQAPTVRQPTDVPDAPATPTPPVADTPSGPAASEGPMSTTDSPGSGPGDGPGNGPGIGPGIGPGNGPGVEPADDPTGPVYLTAEMSRPRALQPIQPRYTEPARRAGVQGTVIVEAIIDEKGHATNVRVVRGLPMGLDRSAVEAIQQVTFLPAMRNGRPVKVYFNLTVNFTIQR